MRLVMYQDCISPHQMPLAKQLATWLGDDEFRYVYVEKEQSARVSLGWNMSAKENWLCHIKASATASEDILVKADCLITGIRDVGLFESRAKSNLKTLYQSERWFKPRIGFFRLVNPSFFIMARRFVSLLRGDDKLAYLAMGIHAAEDMARLCGLFAGDFRCLFRAPELDFEKKPGGKIWLKNGGDGTRYCLGKMRMWGYFVEPSKFKDICDTQPTISNSTLTTIKVLWVGRLLKWKRVDTIIRSIGELAARSGCSTRVTLDIYGAGPEEKRLKKISAKYGNVIKFHSPVPICEVRKLMREHDVYVLASNGYEGWGAVVCEALEEGMKVIGTYEAGASATILPESNLFHVGDWQELKRLLKKGIPKEGISCWRAKEAAVSLIYTIGEQ